MPPSLDASATPLEALLPHTIVTAHATTTDVSTRVETDAAAASVFPISRLANTRSRFTTTDSRMRAEHSL